MKFTLAPRTLLRRHEEANRTLDEIDEALHHMTAVLGRLSSDDGATDERRTNN